MNKQEGKPGAAVSSTAIIGGIIALVALAGVVGFMIMPTSSPSSTVTATITGTMVSTKTDSTTSTPVATATPTESITINGAGATFPFPLVAKMSNEYLKVKPSVQVNYQSIGSGGGIRQHTE